MCVRGREERREEARPRGGAERGDTLRRRVRGGARRKEGDRERGRREVGGTEGEETGRGWGGEAGEGCRNSRWVEMGVGDGFGRRLV